MHIVCPVPLHCVGNHVRFKGAAQFVGNIAKEYGGGAISMEGGDMRSATTTNPNPLT